MRARRTAVEIAVAGVLLAVACYVWLHPASRELIAGNAAVMIGEGSDSITNPWQYQLVIDTFRQAPWRLLLGAVFSDQIAAPDGYAALIPFSERAFVLLLAPFARAEQMPTAVVWLYMITSGLAMHACGRLLGWPRAVAFAMALAWAICPYTRARAECHIALVGVYFAPAAFAAILVLNGRAKKLLGRRAAVVVAAGLFLAAAAAAHYYVVLLLLFSPALLTFHLVVAPKAPTQGTARRSGRLLIASLPAAVLLFVTVALPVTPADARRISAEAPSAAGLQPQRELSLRLFGAEPVDYVAGDTRFGDRDLLPPRRVFTRAVRNAMPVNTHERTNGIRWGLLASYGALSILVATKKGRLTLGPSGVRVAVFATVFAPIAFAFSLPPQGLRLLGHDAGPVVLLQAIVPAFRNPNRVGVLVHFAVLLASGTLWTAVVARRSSWGGPLLSAALLGAVVLEYLPLHPVISTQTYPVKKELTPPGGRCGAGLAVPYVSFDFEAEDYYRLMAELRGTSCKILHAAYMTPTETALARSLGTRKLDANHLGLTLALARCSRAEWIAFRLDTPEEYRRELCGSLGWSRVAPDACRGEPGTAGPPRPLRECLEGSSAP